MLIKKIEEFVLRQELFKSAESVCVAFSGGADSSALLDIICKIAAEWQLDVSAAHFNHNLRGAESDRDEAFCRRRCEQLGIPLYVGSGDVAAYAAEKGCGTEAAARELRYAFFETLTAKTVLTAHNADDNLETILLNLLRGSGSAGLAGIPPRRGRFSRPLLCCEKSEILNYCETNGIDFVVDSTNFTDCADRNILRSRVLPVLRELNPAAVRTALRSSELLRSDAVLLDELAKQQAASLRRSDGLYFGGTIPPEPLLARILRDELAGLGADPSFSDITRACALVRGGGGSDTVCGLRLSLCKGLLSFGEGGEPPEPKALVLGENFWGKKRIFLTLLQKAPEKGEIYFNSSLNYDKINGCLTVGGRRSGDRLSPCCGGGGKSLKKLYNERGIPPARRADTAVISDSDGPVFVEGIGPDIRVKPDSGQLLGIIISEQGAAK